MISDYLQLMSQWRKSKADREQQASANNAHADPRGMEVAETCRGNRFAYPEEEHKWRDDQRYLAGHTES